MVSTGHQPATAAEPDGSGRSAAVPAGYRAVSLFPQQQGVPLRLCVLAREQPDPVLGHFVVVNDTIDARVLLGCVIDAAGNVQQWIELWLQDLQGLSQTLMTCRDALNNRLLDERWSRHFESMLQANPRSIIRTGWETKHPLPLHVNTSEWEPVNPVHAESGHYWELCRDDAILAAAGLPRYSDSLHRYLYVAELDAQSPFIPLTDDAPQPPEENRASISSGNQPLVPLNPSGGFMIAREHNPLDYELFIDVLAGKRLPTNPRGRSSSNLSDDLANLVLPGTPAAGAIAAASDSDNGREDLFNFLFLGTRGMAGRLLEVFHLKLRAIADATAAVRAVALATQRPLLNLAPQSFRVRMSPKSCGVPRLWTASVTLAQPGDAIELALPGTQTAYYLPGRADAISIYRPAEAGRSLTGRASLRIRQILMEASGAIIEGTLSTPERLHPARNDLVRLRVPLGGGRVDLYARLESQSALAAGELRFRTVPQKFNDKTLSQLRAAEGVPIGFTSFELIPLLSTPCDLYSLGVLAVRTLLVDAQATLAVALDETLSLARQVSHEHDDAVPIVVRTRNIFDRDKRWAASLGPHRLVHDQISPEDAFDSVPPELWFAALSSVVRMFPGIGPGSVCRDYGDAPPGGMHRVFDQTLEEFESLLVRTRSLIMLDWRHNREINALIRGQLASLETSGSSSAGRDAPGPSNVASDLAAPGPTTQPAPAGTSPPAVGPARAAPAPTIAPATPAYTQRVPGKQPSPFSDGNNLSPPPPQRGKQTGPAGGGGRAPAPQTAPRRAPPTPTMPPQQPQSLPPPANQPAPQQPGGAGKQQSPATPRSQPVRLPWSES